MPQPQPAPMTISLPRRRCVASLLAAGASFVGIVPTAFATNAPMDPSRLYRPIGATHLYRTYRDRIYQGRLPPLLYAIAITETELDERGNVVSAVVTREPAAAKEVGAWVVSMIRAASPFPPPAGQTGGLRYTDVWLVDRSYRFQLDTLTEGQD